MTIVLSSQLLALGLVLIGLKVIVGVVTRSRQNASAKARGCEPVPLANPKSIFGFRLMKSLLAAYSKTTIPMWHMQRLDAVGRNIHTVQAKLLVNQPLITRDERNLRAVLSSQIDDWKLGTLREGIFRKFNGLNVFVLEGQLWKHSRSLIRNAFARESVFNLAMYERHVQDFFLNIHTDRGGWTETLDLQPVFFSLLLDIITELLYGYSVHGQNPQKRSQLAAQLGTQDLPDAQSFIDNLNQASKYIGFTALFGKMYNLAPSLKYYRIRHAVRKYSDWFVRRRLNQLPTSKVDSELASDGRFILLNELSSVTRDPLQLRSETIGLLAAGRGTTAALLSWVIYYLARNRRIFDKLRAIILSEFGDDFNIHRTSFAELRNCKYLQYVVNEALRIGSPQPATTREAAKDTTLPSGGGSNGTSPIFVPKGTTIVLNFFALHHRADLWGTDVDVFRPERWEERKIDWTFIPFGGGPRKCAGGMYPHRLLFQPRPHRAKKPLGAFLTVPKTDHSLQNSSRSPRPTTSLRAYCSALTRSRIWIRLITPRIMPLCPTCPAPA